VQGSQPETTLPAFPYPRSLWANRTTIKATPPDGRTRVILLGESVARGFVLDPVYTPADVLTNALERKFPGRFDVVDLACTGIGPSQLLAVAEEAMQISPKYVVLFAGNNWWNAYWHLGGSSASDSLSGRTAAEIESQVGKQTRLLARLVLQKIWRACEKAKAELLLVIPEFNLGDWHHERLLPAWLDKGPLQRWLILEREVLAENDSPAKLECVEEMVCLDGGLSAYSLELKGRELLRRGDSAAAHTSLSRARDASCWATSFGTPRCPSSVQDELRALGKAGRARIIDLPAEFGVLSDNGIPDRRLFLDYVHLTPEAIDLAMEAVSAVVNEGERCGEPPQKSVVSPRAFCTTYFLTALHNQHCGQPDSIIRYWLHKSLLSSPDAPLTIERLVKHADLGSMLLCETDPCDEVEAKFWSAFSLRPASNLRLRSLLPAVGAALEKNVEHWPARLAWFGSELHQVHLDGDRWPANLGLQDMNQGYFVERTECTRFILPRSDHPIEEQLELTLRTFNEISSASIEVGAEGLYKLRHEATLSDQWIRLALDIGTRRFLGPLPVKIRWDQPDGTIGFISEGVNEPQLFLSFGQIASIRLLSKSS
jgi:hypothetical protein